MGAILRHQRIIDNHEIKLFERIDKVEFTIHNLETGDSNRSEVNIPEQLQEYDVSVKVQYLSNCEVIIRNGLFPSFIGYSCHKWPLNGYEISLLRDENDLIWQLFEMATGTRSQTSINSTYFYNNYGAHRSYNTMLLFKASEKYEPFGMKLGDFLKRCTKNKTLYEDYITLENPDFQKCFKKIEDLILYLKGCKIEEFEVKNGRIKHFWVKRVIEKSKLDPSKFMDSDKWAITLINTGKSSKGDTHFGHTAIIIEAIEKKRRIGRAGVY